MPCKQYPVLDSEKISQIKNSRNVLGKLSQIGKAAKFRHECKKALTCSVFNTKTEKRKISSLLSNEKFCPTKYLVGLNTKTV